MHVHSFMPIHACPLAHNHADRIGSHAVSSLRVDSLTMRLSVESSTPSWYFGMIIFFECFNGKWDFCSLIPTSHLWLAFLIAPSSVEPSSACQVDIDSQCRNDMDLFLATHRPIHQGFFAKIIDDFQIPDSCFLFFGRKTGFRPCQSKTILECCVSFQRPPLDFFSIQPSPPHPSSTLFSPKIHNQCRLSLPSASSSWRFFGGATGWK